MLKFIGSVINQGLYTTLQTVTITDKRVLASIILNILLYMPLGYLLPFVWPGLMRAKRAASVFYITLIGFFYSLATESAQLVFHIGSFEVDDIFNNTLGCFMGCILYIVIRKFENRGSKE